MSEATKTKQEAIAALSRERARLLAFVRRRSPLEPEEILDAAFERAIVRLSTR